MGHTWCTHQLAEPLQCVECPWHQGPCAHDGLSAKLIEDAGFQVAFMSGFGVAAARLGAPDTNLLSYSEVLDQGRCSMHTCTHASMHERYQIPDGISGLSDGVTRRSINEATRAIPIIGDGDTGYGNALNVKRTVRGFAAAGFAGILIEDQVWHAAGDSAHARHAEPPCSDTTSAWQRRSHPRHAGMCGAGKWSRVMRRWRGYARQWTPGRRAPTSSSWHARMRARRTRSRHPPGFVTMACEAAVCGTDFCERYPPDRRRCGGWQHLRTRARTCSSSTRWRARTRCARCAPQAAVPPACQR